MSFPWPEGHSAKSSLGTDEGFYFSIPLYGYFRQLDRQLDSGWYNLLRGGEPPSPPSLQSFTKNCSPDRPASNLEELSLDEGGHF